MKFSTSILALCAISGAAAAEVFTVTSLDDSGDGSLRAALAAAAAGEGPQTILMDVPLGGSIDLASGLVYEGTAPLTVVGNETLLAVGVNETVFSAPNGPDLTLSGLTLEGPGGFSIEARGDLDGPGGKGLFVGVPEGREGTVSVSLTGVVVAEVASHGIHISDCDLADDCGGGQGGAGGGAPASIDLSVNTVAVISTGNGRFDSDGIRVDERGVGDIRFTGINITIDSNGADGIELDEGDIGSVFAKVSDAAFTTNGNYCDPAIMGAYVPDPDEAEFDQGTTQEADIPGPVEGSPDDTCVEREVDTYDDGSVEVYEFGLDLDDAFDIDEAGPGDIVVLFADSSITDNRDEGLDFDEENDGGIFLTVLGTDASGNTDDGIKLSEEDAGDVTFALNGASITGNGGKGIVLEEAGPGSLSGSVTGLSSEGNDDSDGTGIEAVQEDDGSGSVTVGHSTVADGFDMDGVELTEN